MSKYSDTVALLEWATKMANNKPAKAERKRKPRPEDYDLRDFDAVAFIHKEIERADTLKKLLHDYEKANKKEDKKPEGLSTFQLASLFMVFALIAPLYLRLLTGH